MSIASPKYDALCSEPCIAHFLDVRAASDPGAIAILAPGRAPLTYDRLYHHVHGVCRTLNAMGVGRGDRVALIVPSGPEMAVAFIAVAASAACAPLNLSYQASELEFYLSDLDAQALIIQAGVDSPARTIAQRRGITIVELTPDLAAEAGTFTLTGDGRSSPTRCGFAHPKDIALVLHTSGTTARPKKVPLTHDNVCISARNIVVALALTGQDRCLNVMPLYHIHGLVGGTLSPLTAGGSAICPPRFDPDKFFTWLDELHPTWYTAAPALHQAILSHAQDHPDVIKRSSLRFIRSTSAALAPQVMLELERVFGAPVIEAYSMTEAAHQVCSNPLPPRPRRVGSVGLATGATVAIMDAAGNLLPTGTLGEVVIRGPGITPGYEGNPAANAASFRNGWFRTGDQGVLDADGYLFIRGRLKEIINRGGEKISPREVDEVLLDHRDIAQAVTFALPHPMLGEDVAAAVVLREHTSATEAEIRQYAATRLAEFKVPCRVLIVDELPKGPTGKLRRLNLAQQFGPLLETQFVPPSTPIEMELARIWADVLRVARVGTHDNFFELGGTSLSAVKMFAEVRKSTGRNLPLITLLRTPTIAELANVVNQADSSAPWPSCVAIQPKGTRPPFFCMHSVEGNVLYYRDLARHLGSDQPFYGLQQQGLDGIQAFHTRIEDMAAHYIKELRTLQPEGPYFLGGHSFGGLVAYEVARQLCAQGQAVGLLVLIDTYFPDSLNAASSLLGKVIFHIESLKELEPRQRLGYALERVVNLTPRLKRRISQMARGFSPCTAQPHPTSTPPATDPYLYNPTLREIEKLNRRLAQEFVPQVYPGRATVFLTGSRDLSRGPLKSRNPQVPRLAAGGVEIHEIPGDHGSITREPHVRILAEKLRTCLDKAMRSVHDAAGVFAQPGTR